MWGGRIAAAALVAAAIPGLLAPIPASARVNGIIDGSQPRFVLAVAQGIGPAELGLDPTGDPVIRGDVDGMHYRVLFYGCDAEARCNNLTLTASWASRHFTDRGMGEWNRSRRFSTAYIDAGGNPTLDMNVNLHGGITRASLESTFEWWRLLLAEFTGFLGL